MLDVLIFIFVCVYLEFTVLSFSALLTVIQMSSNEILSSLADQYEGDINVRKYSKTSLITAHLFISALFMLSLIDKYYLWFVV